MALVKVVKTPVAPAFDHDKIITALWGIMKRAAPELSPGLRVRLVAQAIEATGWRQSVENYALHGIRANQDWRNVAGHDWYTLGTLEDRGDGVLVTDSTALWRAYSNYDDSVREGIALMRGSRYGSAWTIREDDYFGWWKRMGELGWYTATGDDPAKRVSGVARRIISTVNRLGLESIPVAPPDDSGGTDDGGISGTMIALAVAAFGVAAFGIWAFTRK